MKAIPRNVLIHKVVLKKLTGQDARGKPTYAEGIDISYVRCESVQRNSITGYGEAKDDTLLLFFDCVNSAPTNCLFDPLDAVVYNGKTYIVRESVPEFGVYGTPHHFEVFLK